MNIIHVGLGTRSRHWFELVARHPGMRSIGCVEADPQAVDWARQHAPDVRQACYAHLADALAGVRADAAIVASPVATRADDAIAALDAGLSVMTEPPLAASVADAARVLATARRAGRSIMVAQHQRFARCERTLQQFVREGRVGGVTHVSCVDRRAQRGASDAPTDLPYPQLQQAAAHHFDSARSILGVNPVTAMARATRAPWSPFAHGSTTEAILEMDGGLRFQYHGSLTSNRDEHALWIEGDTGVLWTDRRRVWWRKRGWPIFLPLRARTVLAGDAARPPLDGTASLLAGFEAATLGRQTPETSGEDNVWTLSMVEAAMRSDRTGAVADVRELLAAAGLMPSAPPAAAAHTEGVR